MIYEDSVAFSSSGRLRQVVGRWWGQPCLTSRPGAAVKGEGGGVLPVEMGLFTMYMLLQQPEYTAATVFVILLCRFPNIDF